MRFNVRFWSIETHPIFFSFRSILEHLATVFSELILADQNCFGDEDGAENLLQLIPDAGVAEALRKLWSNDPSRHSEDRWQDFKTQIKNCEKGSQQRVCCHHYSFTIILACCILVESHCSNGGHHYTVHIPTTGCGSFKAQKPLAQSPILCPS